MNFFLVDVQAHFYSQIKPNNCDLLVFILCEAKSSQICFQEHFHTITNRIESDSASTAPPLKSEQQSLYNLKKCVNLLHG